MAGCRNGKVSHCWAAALAGHLRSGHDDGPVRTEGYGYGWFIGSVWGEHPVIYHTGDNPGFFAINAWFPLDEMRLVLLANDEATDIRAIFFEMIAAAFPRSSA